MSPAVVYLWVQVASRYNASSSSAARSAQLRRATAFMYPPIARAPARSATEAVLSISLAPGNVARHALSTHAVKLSHEKLPSVGSSHAQHLGSSVVENCPPPPLQSPMASV
jgi:hypothetical protein